MIVADDTNSIAYLLIEGEFTEQLELVYQSDSDRIAPYLWRSKFRNILALYLRKNYLSLADIKTIMTTIKPGDLPNILLIKVFILFLHISKQK